MSVPVFQAVVDLESGETLAYEALTRFTDGTPPDVIFAEAAAAGMSIPLEAATARAALEAASPLPANLPIHINVSPELILAGQPLRGTLREWGFGVVLEVTEHAPISDYGAVRDAVTALGAAARLAVDDAGAGFASLRHILELRPAVVKLDISIIRGIESDPARQALVAGMVHFAARLDFALVAEGVETARTDDPPRLGGQTSAGLPVRSPCHGKPARSPQPRGRSWLIRHQGRQTRPAAITAGAGGGRSSGHHRPRRGSHPRPRR